MEDTDILKVRSFLMAHDYIVKVKQVGEDECEARFPHAKITKHQPEPEIINYKIKRDKETGVYVNNEFWSAPEYAIRLMIACDIINRMKKIPVHESLIAYYKEDKEVDKLMELLPHPSNEEDKKKEGFLAGLMTQAMEDKFSPMYEEVANTKEHNVGTGYRLLKSFF